MENNFINGLIIKKPQQGTPDFVKFRLSIKRMELIEWLKSQQGEWINADVLESKAGDKLYAKVNTYVPQQSNNQPASKIEPVRGDDGEEVPF